MKMTLILLLAFIMSGCTGNTDVPAMSAVPVADANMRYKLHPRVITPYPDTLLPAYQRSWLGYISPEDYTLLRLNIDSLRPFFKRRKGKLFAIPDYEKLGDYYGLPPHLHDAVFQDEGMKMHIDPHQLFNEGYLYSYETQPHFQKGIFAVTVLVSNHVYLTRLYYLIYTAEGRLIDKLAAAEDQGDGGYGHVVKGRFKNDSTYLTWGEGSEADGSAKGYTAFNIDTAVYIISGNGKVREIKK